MENSVSATADRRLKKPALWVTFCGVNLISKKIIAFRYHNDFNDQYDYNGYGGQLMSQSISAVEARQKFGEMLNRVALLREEIIIEKYRHCLREIYK